MATIPGPRGERTAAVRTEARVETSGASACRIEIVFGPGHRYLAVSNGHRTWVSPSPSWLAPAGLAGWRHGCVLLPLGSPARLSYSIAGRALTVEYSQYQPGPAGAYPADVVIRDAAGHALLQVSLVSVAAAPELPAADFELPPLPKPAIVAKGGAR